MFIKKYESIMAREVSYRGRWALGLAAFFFVLIFMGFGFYRGFLSFGNNTLADQKSSDQLANVISAEKAPSPMQNTKQTFQSVFSEINKQYKDLKESLSAVFVPFITGIEVYERK
jgi:hypothetical protein